MTSTRIAACGLAALLVACGDSPTEVAAPCVDTTTSVVVTVSAGLQPTFTWEPACWMALLLVEEGSGDQWGVTTDAATWGDPALANLIAPPASYGVVPASTSQLQAPATLASGTTYELILWRILATGNAAPCLGRLGNACIVAIHEFLR